MWYKIRTKITAKSKSWGYADDADILDFEVNPEIESRELPKYWVQTGGICDLTQIPDIQKEVL